MEHLELYVGFAIASNLIYSVRLCLRRRRGEEDGDDLERRGSQLLKIRMEDGRNEREKEKKREKG